MIYNIKICDWILLLLLPKKSSYHYILTSYFSKLFFLNRICKKVCKFASLLICKLQESLGIKTKHSISIYKKQWLPNSVIVDLVLSSKSLSHLKTADWINSSYENGRVDVVINNVWTIGSCVLVKLLVKNCVFQLLSLLFFL